MGYTIHISKDYTDKCYFIIIMITIMIEYHEQRSQLWFLNVIYKL